MPFDGETKTYTYNIDALVALRQARALISDEARWIRGFDAVGEITKSNGLPKAVPAQSSLAVRWCARGSIMRANDNIDVCNTLLRELSRDLGGQHIVEYNDSHYHSHADVLRVFDKTIERIATFGMGA